MTMKTMQRFLVVVIAVASVFMPVLASGPARAAAGDIAPGPAFSDISGHPAEVALTLLGSLGIFTGSYGLGGPVDPDAPITREQFCKVVVVAEGLAAQADLLKNVRPDFKDGATISTWAWGYVNVLSAQGIISGYEDKTFRPKNPVRYSEAIKMLVCTVPGHKAQTNPALGWPNQWLFYAVAHDFLDGVTPDPSAYCTRGDMARMLFATMLVEPLKPDGTPDTGKALLHTAGPNPNWWTGQFLGASGGSFTLSTWGAPIPLADRVYLVGASSYDRLVGTDVECAAGRDGKVVYIRRAAGASNTGHFVGLGSDAGGTFFTLAEGQKYYYTSPVTVTLNRLAGFTETDLSSGDYVIVNTDASGKATAVSATRYDLIRDQLLLIPPQYRLHEDVLAVVTPAAGSLPAKLAFPAASPFWYRNRAANAWAPLAGVTVEIGSACAVKINGAPATPNDLLPGDVIKAATLGALGYQDKTSIIEISATRQVVDGTVVTNTVRTTAEGTTYWVTIKEGSVEREYQRDWFGPLSGHGYLDSDLIVGQRYRLAKNEAGRLFYSLGFTTSNPIVYVKGATTGGGGAPPYSITVDNQGVDQVLSSTINPVGWVGHFAVLNIDGATGQVTWAIPVDPTVPAKVVSATATDVTLQSVPPGSYWFGQAPPCVIYRKDGAAYTYIGPAGLSNGLDVKVCLDGSTPKVIVYEP